MEKNEYYTELSFRHKMPGEDGAMEVTIKEPSWELDGDEFFDLVYKVFVSAGYMPESFGRCCNRWIEEHEQDD